MQKYLIIISSILIIFFYFTSKKSKLCKAGLTFSVFLIYSTYIILRIFSIPFQYGAVSTTLGILLLLAEILSYFSFIVFIYIFFKQKKVKIIPLEKDEKKLPTVDVLICTYNEPIDLVFTTIVGAMNLDYPKELLNIYILDDGRRDEFKKLAEDLEIHYITRTNNEFAKAGNLNNALKHINGDLFLVLDADMIPKKECLQKTVGQFKDPNLAFVQIPQTFYNADVYQYNTHDKFYNEQDFFMRCIEPARNSRDVVLNVGTNSIFRRTCIDSIGGYPTKSITEDMAVGLLLQGKGYNSTFINEPLIVGLTALNFEDLIKQRDRWCRGNLQVYKHYKNVMKKNLKFPQRMIYLDGVVYWFTGFRKMIFLTLPIIHLLTGIALVNYDKLFLLPLFLSAFISQILLSKRILQKYLPKGYLNFLYTDNIYATVMAPHLIYFVLKHYFFSDTKFSVTNKKSDQNKIHFTLKYSWCCLILFILSIVSVIIGTKRIFTDNLPLVSFLINSFWIIYNIPGLLTAIQIGYQKPRPRNAERITFNEETGIRVLINSKEYIARIFDASTVGVKIEMPKEIISKLTENDKIQVIIGRTKIDTKIHSVEEENKVVLVFPDDLELKKKIIVVKLILKFLKPYKDNYNLSID